MSDDQIQPTRIFGSAVEGFTAKFDDFRSVIVDVLNSHNVIPEDSLVDELVVRCAATVDSLSMLLSQILANNESTDMPRERGTNV